MFCIKVRTKGNITKPKISSSMSLLLRLSKHIFFEDDYVSDVTIVAISTRSNISEIIFKQIFCSGIHSLFSYVLLILM